MEFEIKKINTWSAIKISFVVYGVLGFLVGIFYGVFIFSLGSLLGSLANEDFGPFSGMFTSPAGGFFFTLIMGFFLAFVMAVVYGVIVTAIIVWLYNLFSKWTGGIKVNLEKTVTMVPASTSSELGGAPV